MAGPSSTCEGDWYRNFCKTIRNSIVGNIPDLDVFHHFGPAKHPNRLLHHLAGSAVTRKYSSAKRVVMAGPSVRHASTRRLAQPSPDEGCRVQEYGWMGGWGRTAHPGSAEGLSSNARSQISRRNQLFLRFHSRLYQEQFSTPSCRTPELPRPFLAAYRKTVKYVQILLSGKEIGFESDSTTYFTSDKTNSQYRHGKHIIRNKKTIP